MSISLIFTNFNISAYLCLAKRKIANICLTNICKIVENQSILMHNIQFNEIVEMKKKKRTFSNLDVNLGQYIGNIENQI